MLAIGNLFVNGGSMYNLYNMYINLQSTAAYTGTAVRLYSRTGVAF